MYIHADVPTCIYQLTYVHTHAHPSRVAHQAIDMESDHLFELNYAITLYKHGDIKQCTKHFSRYVRVCKACMACLLFYMMKHEFFCCWMRSNGRSTQRSCRTHPHFVMLYTLLIDKRINLLHTRLCADAQCICRPTSICAHVPHTVMIGSRSYGPSWTMM